MKKEIEFTRKVRLNEILKDGYSIPKYCSQLIVNEMGFGENIKLRYSGKDEFKGGYIFYYFNIYDSNFENAKIKAGEYSVLVNINSDIVYLLVRGFRDEINGSHN
ncbi:MAG: hypothetical protein ACOC56_01935 [Atribacterota bacterium]